MTFPRGYSSCLAQNFAGSETGDFSKTSGFMVSQGTFNNSTRSSCWWGRGLIESTKLWEHIIHKVSLG